MKSYNYRILMACMNYSISSIMGIVGVLLGIVSNSMSSAFAGEFILYETGQLGSEYLVCWNRCR